MSLPGRRVSQHGFRRDGHGGSSQHGARWDSGPGLGLHRPGLGVQTSGGAQTVRPTGRALWRLRVTSTETVMVPAGPGRTADSEYYYDESFIRPEALYFIWRPYTRRFDHRISDHGISNRLAARLWKAGPGRGTARRESLRLHSRRGPMI
jgi:hypothetical protein